MTTTTTTHANADAEKTTAHKGAHEAPEKKKAAAKSTDAATGPVEPKYHLAKGSDIKTPELKLSEIVWPDFDGRAAEAPIDDHFVASIKANGVMNPITVQPLADGTYLLVAGRRRYKAAKQLGLKSIPVNVVVAKDDKANDTTAEYKLEVMAVAENLDRQAVNAYDLYVKFAGWIEQGKTQAQIAKDIHRTDGFVSQHLAIGKLNPPVKALIHSHANDGAVLSKARALYKLNDYPDAQLAAAKQCFDKNDPWSVTRLQQVVDDALLEIQEEEEKAKQREKEKKQRAAGGETKVTVAPEEKEKIEKQYEKVEIEPTATKTLLRSALKFAELHLKKARLMPEKTKEEAAAKREKVAYERGRLDTLQMAAGLKEWPKSVVEPAKS
jgi:ParB/RepB/Spo0J family partition protein